MKKLMLLFAVLIAGCDLLGNENKESTPDLITYRIESQDEKPSTLIGPSPILYSIDSEHYGEAHLTEYPWEVSIPHFDGPKYFAIHTSPKQFTMTVLRNDAVIARTESNGGGGPGHITGIITGADVYEILTEIATGGTTFTSNYINSIELVKSGRHAYINEFHPGERLRLTKSEGMAAFSIFVQQPRLELLAGYSGTSPTTVDIQFDIR